MKLTLYTDGGARGNPGPAAGGIVILDHAGKTVLGKSKYFGETTNNQAEYQALILGLVEAAKQADPDNIELQVFMDSELIIKQMRGEYRVKEPGLQLLNAEAKKLALKFSHLTFTHIRREKNADADALVNAELDKRA